MAVEDRLRTRKVGIFMSGGIDSPMVAATAKAVMARSGTPYDLRAFSAVYDHLIPDEERRYAHSAAASLDIPIHFMAADGYLPFQTAGRVPPPAANPGDNIFAAKHFQECSQVAEHSRVALSGWDGDAVLSVATVPYFLTLWRQRRLARLAGDLARAAASSPVRRALRPAILRRLAMKARHRGPESAGSSPDWIARDFAVRVDLKERLKKMRATAPIAHPEREYAIRSFSSPAFTTLFDAYDPGTTGVSLEVRHPLLDLRLVQYLLSLPPVPWCIHKTLFREHLRGRMSDAVRLRPKTALAGDPLQRLIGDDEGIGTDFSPHPDLKRFVDLETLQRAAITWEALLVRSLNDYLEQHVPVSENI
jgi:asparagine synthase (glutamine-hydrolysing)